MQTRITKTGIPVGVKDGRLQSALDVVLGIAIIGCLIYLAIKFLAMFVGNDLQARAFAANFPSEMTVEYAFFLMVYLLFRREIGWRACGWMFVAASVSSAYIFINAVLEAPLTVVYHQIARIVPSVLFFSNGGTAAAVPPLYAITLVALSALVARRSYRSMDRLFVLIVGVVVFVSTVMCHFVFINDTLQIRVAQRNAAVMQQIINLPDAYFFEACRSLEYTCSEHEMKQKFVHWDPRYVDIVERLKREAKLPPPSLGDREVVIKKDSAREHPKYGLFAYQIGLMRTATIYRVMIDDTGAYNQAFKYSALNFTTFCFMIHAFWLCGGLYLLAFHKRRHRMTLKEVA